MRKRVSWLAWGFLSMSVSCLGFTAPGISPGVQQSVDDDIIKSALRTVAAKGGYTVVWATTGFGLDDPNDAKNAAQTKAYILKELGADTAIDKRTLEKLAVLLLDRNKTPERLRIESAPQDGYLIDYEGKFARYFEADGGGWSMWHKDYPDAHGWTEVSLPAYDEASGLVLIYLGTQLAPLAGAGYVIAYRYDGRELFELGRVMLWIS